METERLMRQEIERLQGEPKLIGRVKAGDVVTEEMLRGMLENAGDLRICLGDENEAEAVEGARGAEVRCRVAEGGVRGMNAHARDVWVRGYHSRKRAAIMKSPAILASKARLRRRRAERLKTKFVDEGRNNVRPKDLAWNRMAIPGDRRAGCSW